MIDNLTVGVAIVACPTCAAQITIPVHVTSGVDKDGYPVIAATPDVSAAWDHYEDSHMTTKEASDDQPE